MVADNDYVVEVGFPVKFDALKLQMKTKARLLAEPCVLARL